MHLDTKKLFKVTCRGMNFFSTGVVHGIAYVVANHPTQAYEILRKHLDKSNLGFTSERELESIELIAEDYEYTNTKIMLFIDSTDIEKLQERNEILEKFNIENLILIKELYEIINQSKLPTQTITNNCGYDETSVSPQILECLSKTRDLLNKHSLLIDNPDMCIYFPDDVYEYECNWKDGTWNTCTKSKDHDSRE